MQEQEHEQGAGPLPGPLLARRGAESQGLALVLCDASSLQATL